MKVKTIYDYLCEWAPLELQESYDNAGLQIGSLKNKAKRILVSLDLTKDVVNYAVENNIDLIINHHPIFFNEIKSINYDENPGDIILPLIKKEISVIAMHTNLDRTENGVNDVLAKRLNINVIDGIEDGMGRYGNIDTQNAMNYLKFVKESLKASHIEVYGNIDKDISKIGICGGSGSDLVFKAVDMNLDMLITADVGYHKADYAINNGLVVVDAGHYYTENVIVEEIKNKLKIEFPKLEIFTYNRQEDFSIVI